MNELSEQTGVNSTSVHPFVIWCKRFIWLAIGWWHPRRQHGTYRKRVDVLVNRGNGTEQLGGLVVSDPPSKNTVILRDDGIIQRGGVFRPASR